VCLKDPGFAVDLICPGNIADFVAIYLGHAVWRDVAEKAISIEGDRQMARHDKVPGRDFPVVRPAAQSITRAIICQFVGMVADRRGFTSALTTALGHFGSRTAEVCFAPDCVL
jgi:hypothetical protein